METLTAMRNDSPISSQALAWAIAAANTAFVRSSIRLAASQIPMKYRETRCHRWDGASAPESPPHHFPSGNRNLGLVIVDQLPLVNGRSQFIRPVDFLFRASKSWSMAASTSRAARLVHPVLTGLCRCPSIEILWACTSFSAVCSMRSSSPLISTRLPV